MKITIEFNSKRIKDLRHSIEINKKISDIHENRVNELLTQNNEDRKEYNKEINELSKSNKLLLEVVTDFENKNKELKEQLQKVNNQ